MPIEMWDAEEAAALVDPLAIDALAGRLLVLAGATAAHDEHLGWTRRAPCVVVGLAPAGATPSATVDIALDEGDERTLAAVDATVRAHPQASRMLVDVLRTLGDLDVGAGRHVAAGLIVESLAYSTLLAGPEHARWLDGRGRRGPRHFDADPVRVERHGHRLELALARPENRNAFSAAMRDALFEALALPQLDPTVEVVRITGDGPTFCSGGDLDEFGTTPDPVRAHEVRTRRSVGAALHRCPARTEVHVHGRCVGAGVELPAFADHVIADPDTTFHLPEVAMGLIPGAGGTVSLTRRIGRQATARFALAGDAVDAATALTWGLVDAVA